MFMHLISQGMFVTVPNRISVLLSYPVKSTEHNQKEPNVTNIVFPLVRGEVGPFVLRSLS